ncbi:MFS transporter [Aestuariimicrobium ganziense]|uniref:MFS transporter n=1 Tax=Aestuariimicrobium ganziense TaxID=2773677 RepID=UPI001943AF55|nr:MFS transporter [Aestuariimicrobium ganziense]
MSTTTTEGSALAPFKRRAFLWVWLGVLVASMATWMQTVGAQWLLVQSPNATIVALVQAAASLPMMLLALPSGVLADAFDKRRILLSVQAAFMVLGVSMAVLTATSRMTPGLVLLFTVLWGAAVAMQLPTYQSLIPELVRREHLKAAIRLDMVSVNVSRAAGPALAGFIIAAFGVPEAFGTAALLVLPLTAILLVWKRPKGSLASSEPFLHALRTGGRFAWNEPAVKRIFTRCFLFVLGGSAMWALLPLVASQELGVGASGFGIMFTALGIGAVIGAFGLAGVKDSVSANQMLALSSVVFAAGLAGTVLLGNYWLVLASLVFCGLAWMGAVSTLNSDIALILPVWVRARGLALMVMMFTSAQVVGSVLWGQVTDAFSLRTAMLAAAGLLLVTVVVGLLWRMPDTQGFDPAASYIWNEADMAIEVDESEGPVAVSVDYWIALDRQEEFLAAMEQVRRLKLRTGATRWELWRDGADPTHFTEVFTIATWGEHLKQHQGRLTAADERIEQVALRLSDPPARATHLLPPGTGAPKLAESTLPEWVAN